jgi:hemolysin activation/secretion protein
MQAVAADIPVSVDPLQVEKKIKPEAEPGEMPESVITQRQRFDPNLPIDFYKKTILLKRVNLEGNTIFLDQEFAKYYSNLLGKEISLASLYEVAEKITNHYRKEGYVLAAAFIPEQELRNGLVKIKIVEGYISNINLEGEFEKTSIIETTIGKIYNIKPFNIKQFERYMLLLNELPGISARAVLKKQRSKDTNLGGVELDILFSKEKGKLGLGWNNSITKYVGKFLTQISYEHPNLGVNNHKLSLAMAASDAPRNFQLINIGDKITLNSEGTSLYVEGSAIRIRPSHQLKEQRIRVTSENLSLNVTHPVLRSRVMNFAPYAGINVNNSRTEALELLINKDRLRVFSLGANFDFFDSFKGANLWNASVSQGLDILDASKKNSFYLSKEGGSVTFTKANIRIARMQNIIDNLNLYLSFNSQYTNDTLLSSELFSVGGANIGKGYEPSALTGDNGFAYTTELRYKLPRLALTESELFVFYDYAKAWNVRKTNQKNSLAISYGTGLRFNIGEFSSAKIIIAQPTTGKVFLEENKKSKKPAKLILGLYIRA